MWRLFLSRLWPLETMTGPVSQFTPSLVHVAKEAKFHFSLNNSKSFFFGYILDVFSLFFTKFRVTLHKEKQTKKHKNKCKRKRKTISEWLLCALFDLIESLVSFKILHRFWFVKTTRITHHNQLLLTKIRRELILNRWRQKLCHIEPMTSNWRQKCSPLQVIGSLTKGFGLSG